MESKIKNLYGTDNILEYEDGDLIFKMFFGMPGAVVLVGDEIVQSFGFPRQELTSVIKYCDNMGKIMSYADNYTKGVTNIQKLYAAFEKAHQEKKIGTSTLATLKVHFRDTTWSPSSVRNQLIILDVADIFKDAEFSEVDPRLIKSCEYMKKFADEIPAYLKQHREV